MSPPTTNGLTVSPITPERWDDLATVFGPSGNRASWCWCRRFLGSGGHLTPDGSPDNRAALRAEIATAAMPPGLIATVDGTPAGWTRVGPRDGFPGVVDNRALQRILRPDPDTWWVTCFAIARAFRGRGVGSALLEAAVLFARDHGAAAVEGHPVDVENLAASSVGASALFTGTLTMFEGAGFTEIGRTYRTRPVVRRTL